MMDEGWVWFLNSRKAHYIGSDGRSLCGKWAYLGSSFEQGKDNSPDNCASCKRKLKKLREKRDEKPTLASGVRQ